MPFEGFRFVSNSGLIYEGESIIIRNAVAFVFLLAALRFRVHL